MSWGVALSFFGALLGAAAIMYTAIQTKRAASKASTVDQVRADAEAYGEARKTWIAQLNELRRQIAELAARITSLEREKNLQRRRVTALVEYVKALRALLRLHNIDNVPPPPEDVFLEESA